MRREGRYFYSRNDGLQDQATFLVQDGLAGVPRTLLDPNTWSDDGTVALAGAVPSPDGARVAYFDSGRRLGLAHDPRRRR